MKIAILQPGYLPWLGFWSQMAQSDVFVLLDDVQYDKHGWRNRNRIKTAQGEQWLTIPVLSSGRPLIRDVEIDNHTDWRKKHAESLKQSYGKAPYFDLYFPPLARMYAREWTLLYCFTCSLVERLRVMLGIGGNVLLASEFRSKSTDRVQRLVDICKELGANEFLEGSAGRGYLEGEGEELFASNGIRLVYQDYQHPVYPQLHGEFVSRLSIVDLLFNVGPDSLDILTGRKVTRC